MPTKLTKKSGKIYKTGELEFHRIGSFLTELSAQVAAEFNDSNIACHMERLDEHYTAVYVLKHLSSEALEILNAIKKKNKRIRF